MTNKDFAKDLQSYGLSISELSFQIVFPFLPWYFKFVFSAISDLVPCSCGYRKPYLIVGNFLAVVFSCTLMINGLQLGQYECLLLALQTSAVTADVMCDAFLISEAKQETPSEDGNLQTKMDISREIGGLIGGSLGPWLWGQIGSLKVYGILGGLYAKAFTLSFCIQDLERPKIVKKTTVAPSVPLDANGRPLEGFAIPLPEIDIKYSCRYFLDMIREALVHPKLIRILSYHILITALPSASLATFYFLNDSVKLTPGQQSIIHLSGSLSSLITVILIRIVIRYIPVRLLYQVTGFLDVIFTAIPYLLVSRSDPVKFRGTCLRNYNGTSFNDTCYDYEVNHMDPFAITIAARVSDDIIDAIQAQPIKILTKIISADVVGATVFSFTLSLQNSVGALRAYLESVLIRAFNIDHGNYDALPQLILLCAGLRLLVLLLFSQWVFKDTIEDISKEIQEKRFAIQEQEDIHDMSTTTNSAAIAIIKPSEINTCNEGEVCI